MGDSDAEVDAVEFDLTEWPEELRENLEWMLRGSDVAFEWVEEAVIAVAATHADAVEAHLDYLAAGAAEPDDAVSTESDEWRVTGPETGGGSNELSIDDFYEGDPTREDSEESTFGDAWVDHEGVQCELDWIHDTGELYLTRAPKWMPFMVEILEVIPTLHEVEQLLHGWEAAMAQPNSVQWVRDRVAARAQAERTSASEEPAAP